MENACFVNFERNAASLHFSNSGSQVESNRASLGVRHQATRTEHTTNLANEGHAVRGGNSFIKVKPTVFDLLYELFCTSEVSASSKCFSFFFALTEYCYAYGLTKAVRHGNSTADHLIGIFWVNAEADCYVNGFVELSRCARKRLSYSVFNGILSRKVDAFNCIAIFFAELRHNSHL